MIGRFGCGVLAAVAMPLGASAQSGGFASGGGGFVVKAAIVDSAGRPVERAIADTDFRIVLSFTDSLQGRPAAGLKPVTWVRRVAPGNTSCANAAWIVRATGAIATDDIALERSFLVALGTSGRADDEDRLRVLDLDHRLKSANQLSVTSLGATVASFLVHPATPRAFAVRSGANDIVAVDLPWGGLHRFAGGFDRPHLLAAMGADLLVADQAGGGRVLRFDPSGARLGEVAMGAEVVSLSKPSDNTVLATAANGSGVLWTAREAAAPRRFVAGSFPGAVAAGGGVIVAATGRDGLLIRWRDDPDRTVPVTIGFVADRLFVRDDGRYAVAWSAVLPKAAIVDVARSRVVAMPVLADVVHEAAAAGSAIFLTHHSESAVTVVDFAPAAADAAPVERRVRLPVADKALQEPLNTGRLVATPLTASVLAIRPGSNVAFAVAAGGGLSDAPMSAVTIRGDQPRMIARFDRRMAETAPGRFEAALRLSKGGTYEVVSTTGAAGVTTCAAFRVDGPGADEKPPASLRALNEPPRAAEKGRIVLALDNRPDWLTDGPLVVRIDDLAFGWSQRFKVLIRRDAPMEMDIAFPRPGRYVVSIESGGRIAPLTMDVQP